MAAVLAVIVLVYVRLASRGKLVAFFHEKGTFWSALLKYDRENQCLWLGKESSEDREKYMVDESKWFLVQWPAWPSIFSLFTVPVRALEYVRGKSEAYDPEKKHTSKYGAAFLRLVTDVNMLKSQWRDVREALGLGRAGAGLNKWLLLGMIVIVFLSAYNLYMQMRSISVLHQIFNLLHGVPTP